MDYHDKNVLMNLNVCMGMKRTSYKQHYAKLVFNHGRPWLKDEIPEDSTETTVVPENIDAVRELIKKNLVWYAVR